MPRPFEQYVEEYQKRAMLRKLQEQNAGQEPPSFSGSVVHGMTLGYYGTAPTNIAEWAGEFLGSVVPYGIASMATGGLATPLAGALQFGPKIGPIARTAVQYGLAGAAVGGARKADTLSERISNTVTEGIVGAALPAAVHGWQLRKMPTGEFLPHANIRANLPEGYFADPGKPTVAYPTGAFSQIELAQQLRLPMSSVGDVRAEAQAANQLLKSSLGVDQDVIGFAHRAKPRQTVDWLEREAFKKGYFFDHEPGAKRPFRMAPLEKSARTKAGVSEYRTLNEAFDALRKEGPLTEGPPAFELRNQLTGTVDKFRDLTSVKRAVRNTVGTAGVPEQLSIPSVGNMTEEVLQLAKRKGYDVVSNSDGWTVVGTGGHVEHVKGADELRGFLTVRPDAARMPVTEYGTFDRAINREAMTRMDKTMLAAQRVLVTEPPVQLGHGLDTKPTVNGRVNAYVGLETPVDAAQAMQRAADAGYKSTRVQLPSGTQDVVYYRSLDKETKKAVRMWAQMRTAGPRGMGGFDHMLALAREFGVPFPQQLKWATDLAYQTGLDITPHLLKLGQISAPQLSHSPIVAAVTRKVMEANFTLQQQMEALMGAQGYGKYISRLSDSEAQTAMKAVQGEIDFAKLPTKIQEAVNFHRGTMQDFATRFGIPQWTQYATHVTDYDAIWQVSREALVDRANKAMWVQKFGNENTYNNVVELAKKYPGRWLDVPYNIRETLKEKLLHWNVADWDKLPKFLRDKLPDTVFNQYLLPRSGKVPYVKDLRKAFSSYVPTALRDLHYTPVLQEVTPIINRMPGGNLASSEKRYLERYLSTVVLRRPDAFSNLSKHVMENVNRSLGGALGDSNWVNDLISIWRGGFYRGAIGPDTALINATQIINDWAAHGKYMGPALRSMMHHVATRQPLEAQLPGLVGRHVDIAELFPTGASQTAIARAAHVSNKVTEWALKPMAITEWVNRGVAWHAAMEDAVRGGLSVKDMIRLSGAKASAILPDISVSEAQYKAMYDVLRTQFGYDVTMVPPLFSNPLGRVSNLFLSYPIRQMEFMAKGVAKGFLGYGATARTVGSKFAAESLDKMEILRYMALTGFMMTSPFLLAKVGVDVSRVWGRGIMPSSFPFYTTIMNGYLAATGSDPITHEQARRTFLDTAATAVVPQYRWLSKASRTLQAVKRGYATDYKQRYLHPETPAGGILDLAGVTPREYTISRDVAQELVLLARGYRQERREAIEDLVQGKQDTAAKFMQKWGKPITPEDVMKVVAQRSTTPEQRASQGLPQDALMQLAQQRPYLARGIR